jgi:hypothetical protein
MSPQLDLAAIFVDTIFRGKMPQIATKLVGYDYFWGHIRGKHPQEVLQIAAVRAHRNRRFVRLCYGVRRDILKSAAISCRDNLHRNCPVCSLLLKMRLTTFSTFCKIVIECAWTSRFCNSMIGTMRRLPADLDWTIS